MDLNKMYNCVGKETLQNKEIPVTSGVYFFWTKESLIYLGKTKNLRLRISQHFGNGFLTLHMINPEEPEFVSFIETEDEFEALRLESNLLKILSLKYNLFPFYQSKGYYNWKFGIKDKQTQSIDKGEEEIKV